MSPKRGSGTGIYRDKTDGYLRICRRGPLRDQMAHRAYVNRQLATQRCTSCGAVETADQREYDKDCLCGGVFAPQRPPLRIDQEVHHLCRNRACWPPTDFHLLVCDGALHAAFEAGAAPWRKWHARKLASGEHESAAAAVNVSSETRNESQGIISPSDENKLDNDSQ